MTAEIFVPLTERYTSYIEELRRTRVLYLCAFTGFGKTCSTVGTLKQMGVPFAYLSSTDAAFFARLENEKSTLIVVDDEQTLEREEEQAELYRLLLKGIARHKYLILSRRRPRGLIKNLELSGQLNLHTVDDLRMTAANVGAFMQQMGLPVEGAAEIARRTGGYAPFIHFVLLQLQRGTPWGDTLFHAASMDLAVWLDATYWQTIDQRMRDFLLPLASFPKFTVELARMLTGDPDVHMTIAHAMEVGSFIVPQSDSSYQLMPPKFTGYLQTKQNQLWTLDMRRHNDEIAGLYYELNGELKNALECYERAEKKNHVAQLLIRTAGQNPMDALYQGTEKFYRALPEEIVLVYPELMSALSMLCSVRNQPEESERWFDALTAYTKDKSHSKGDRRSAEAMLCHLSLSLPHRGTKDSLRNIAHVGQLMASREMHLAEFAVTGRMPSIFNGGLDFACWSRHDRLIYATSKGMLETVLGKNGVGLPQIALAESLFERRGAKSTTEIPMLLNIGICNAEARGTGDMVFAGMGVMARMMVAQGQSATARHYLQEMRIAEDNLGSSFLRRNLNALLERIALREGDTESAMQYAKACEPEGTLLTLITDRYAFMTKARRLLAMNGTEEAVTILGIMRDYFERYHRPQGVIEANLLMAVAHRRMHDAEAAHCLQAALDTARRYGLIQIIADEGAAVLPLLEETRIAPDDAWMQAVLAATREQAVFYPHYLDSTDKAGPVELKAVEWKILHLLAEGMTNEEIAKKMMLSVNTVKTYLKNIYAVLGVHNRVEACRAAAKKM